MERVARRHAETSKEATEKKGAFLECERYERATKRGLVSGLSPMGGSFQQVLQTFLAGLRNHQAQGVSEMNQVSLLAKVLIQSVQDQLG